MIDWVVILFREECRFSHLQMIYAEHEIIGSVSAPAHLENCLAFSQSFKLNTHRRIVP